MVAYVIISDTSAVSATLATLTSLHRCIFYFQHYALHIISEMAAPLSPDMKKRHTYCRSCVTSEWSHELHYEL